MQTRIFFVEDDLSFGAVLKSYLEINSYKVKWVNDGKFALEQFKEGEYDLCILDIMLPNIDGFTIGREIKLMSPDIPIIFLTAKSLKEDIISGYKTGADDYITKPFDTDVLLCKIEAVMKRSSGNSMNSDSELYQVGKFTFNPALRTITKDSSVMHLSPKESELLRILIKHKDRLLPREVALKAIWGEEGYFTARSMDVYITKLRKYLKDDPSIEIKNIHGSGFIMTC